MIGQGADQSPDRKDDDEEAYGARNRHGHRGADPTKAACRALRDALWHNSLSIATALGQPLDAMIVDVHIGVPRPELVDKAQVMAVLPHGKGTVTVVEGGLEIHNDAGTNSTLIANACVVVSLDIA